ncbi:MAG: hypothetical protein H5U02_00295 [Clostridia bacterium]|nr:hypothetical protein [Clostridia bacterium]
MLSEDIGNYLQINGVGTVGTDIFLGQLPAAPDNVVALFEYAGEPPDLHSSVEYPGLQVLVRNKSYVAGRQKIEQTRNVLHGLTEATINGRRYLLVRARQSPEALPRDENGRALFVCNFRVIKEVG